MIKKNKKKNYKIIAIVRFNELRVRVDTHDNNERLKNVPYTLRTDFFDYIFTIVV